MNPERPKKEVKTMLTERPLAKYLQDLEIDESEMKNAVILDLGSGVNQGFAREVEEQPDKYPGAKVISLDPSIGMPRERDPYLDDRRFDAFLRRSRAQERTLAAFSEDLPFKNETLDRIYALYSVPWATHGAETLRTFREMARVLKSGGRARMYPIVESQREEVGSALAQ